MRILTRLSVQLHSEMRHVGRVFAKLRTSQFVSSQNEFNLLSRKPEAELLPVMEAYGVSLLPYYPLASGLLTGKFRRGAPAPAGTRLSLGGPQAERTLTEANLGRAERIEAFARERGRSLLDVAFGWLAARPVVASVIAGASTAQQVNANVLAAETGLSMDEITQIDYLSEQE